MFKRKNKNGDCDTPKTESVQSNDTPGTPSGKKPMAKRLFRRPVTPVKLIVYCVLAAGAVAAFILLRFVYVTVINPHAAFGDTATSQPSIAATVQATAAALPTATATATATYSPEELLSMEADTDFMKDRVNILMVGIDYSEEREGRTDFRTDTILLLSVNFATGKVDMLSIPRDSYADIAYTDNKWKINGAYMSAGGAEGDGFSCLMQTVSDTIGGIPIHYYIGVEMQTIKDIVDVIGGVWYDVDYEINMNGRHLDKGYQHLDGQAVLDYCRARKGITSGTDIDRIDRQQRLLMSVFNQMKDSATLAEIPQLYSKLQNEIYTNLNFEQIAALALFALDLNLDTSFNRYALQGEYLKAYNATYYVLDHNYTVQVVQAIFGVDVESTIDWSYSLSHVKNDVAKSKLSSEIKAVETIVSQNESALSAELLADARSRLENARSILKKERTADMNEATKNLEALSDMLTQYLANPPAPSVTEAPADTLTTEPAV